jgi:hypothetical protein
MKNGATYKENINFLIMMYKRELEISKDLTEELKEAYENIIIELETIEELSK